MIVFDDLHEIDNPDVLQMVHFLVEHAPPSLTLAIGSRSLPDLPLGRLRARRALWEVTEEDLRLRPDEARDFLRQVAGLDLPPRVVTELHRSVEGWLVGLELVSLALPRRATAVTSEARVEELATIFERGGDLVVQYFAEEVLAAESNRNQDFLLRTSILERFHTDLADAVRQAGELC